MRVTELQLRTVTLAQAIEHADTERTLVSQAERDDATRTAISAARQRGADRLDVGDIVLDRAETIVQRASGRDSTLAALRQPSVRLRWLARMLPLAALVLGLAMDRIANAHRVDLLSAPLLLVVGWNLVMYALLAWRAWRRPSPGPLLAALRQWGRPAAARRSARRGLAARVVADFQIRWLAHTTDLFLQRAARVLHLCAAGWAAGIALSLLLRGLIVRYQFGWESTFLDAGQVHAIVSVLFWPLTALFGLAPFTVQDITATQNFAGEGAAGSRWVGMYVGLLVLVVVLPRLALAAWARWREMRLAPHCQVDLQDSRFDALRRAMPGDLVVGLQGASPARAQAWQGVVATHTGPASPTLQGDRLRFVDAGDAAAHHPVDAVIVWDDAPPDTRAPPSAWQAAPMVALSWRDVGASWVLEPALFDRLEAALPARRHALVRLREAWVARNEKNFDQSLQALALHLRACAQLGKDAGTGAGSDYATRYAQQVRVLDAALRALLPASTPPPTSQPAPPHSTAPPAASRRSLALRTPDGTALAIGTSAGAAAGAATGAKVGALIDIGTGGMTLGAGTALGALLGGTTAWVVRSLHKKNAASDVLQHVIEAACTHYLVITHEARVPAEGATALAGRWRAEVTGTVAAHWVPLVNALHAAPTPADPLRPVLRTMLAGVLRRSFTAGQRTPNQEASQPNIE